MLCSSSSSLDTLISDSTKTRSQAKSRPKPQSLPKSTALHQHSQARSQTKASASANRIQRQAGQNSGSIDTHRPEVVARTTTSPLSPADVHQQQQSSFIPHVHIPPFTLAEFEHFVGAALNPKSSNAPSSISSSGGRHFPVPGHDAYHHQHSRRERRGGPVKEKTSSAAQVLSTRNANLKDADDLNRDDRLGLDLELGSNGVDESEQSVRDGKGPLMSQGGRVREVKRRDFAFPLRSSVGEEVSGSKNEPPGRRTPLQMPLTVPANSTSPRAHTSLVRASTTDKLAPGASTSARLLDLDSENLTPEEGGGGHQQQSQSDLDSASASQSRASKGNFAYEGSRYATPTVNLAVAELTSNKGALSSDQTHQHRERAGTTHRQHRRRVSISISTSTSVTDAVDSTSVPRPTKPSTLPLRITKKGHKPPTSAPRGLSKKPQLHRLSLGPSFGSELRFSSFGLGLALEDIPEVKGLESEREIEPEEEDLEDKHAAGNDSDLLVEKKDIESDEFEDRRKKRTLSTNNNSSSVKRNLGIENITLPAHQQAATQLDDSLTFSPEDPFVSAYTHISLLPTTTATATPTPTSTTTTNSQSQTPNSNTMILLAPPSSVPSPNSPNSPANALAAASTSTIDVGLHGCLSVSLSASSSSGAGSSSGASASAAKGGYLSPPPPSTSYTSGWTDNKKTLSSSPSTSSSAGASLRRKLSAIHIPSTSTSHSSSAGSSRRRPSNAADANANANTSKTASNSLSPPQTQAHANAASSSSSPAAAGTSNPTFFARIKKQLSRNSMVVADTSSNTNPPPPLPFPTSAGYAEAQASHVQEEASSANGKQPKGQPQAQAQPQTKKPKKKASKKLKKKESVHRLQGRQEEEQEEAEPVPVPATLITYAPSALKNLQSHHHHHQQQRERDGSKARSVDSMSTSSLPYAPASPTSSSSRGMMGVKSEWEVEGEGGGEGEEEVSDDSAKTKSGRSTRGNGRKRRRQHQQQHQQLNHNHNHSYHQYHHHQARPRSSRSAKGKFALFAAATTTMTTTTAATEAAAAGTAGNEGVIGDVHIREERVSSPSMYSCESVPRDGDAEPSFSSAAPATPTATTTTMPTTTTTMPVTTPPRKSPLRPRSKLPPPPLVHPAPSTRPPSPPKSPKRQSKGSATRPISFASSLASPTSPTSPVSPSSSNLSPPISPSSPTTPNGGFASRNNRQSWASVFSQGSGASSVESRGPVTPSTPGFYVVVTSEEDDLDDGGVGRAGRSRNISLNALSTPSARSTNVDGSQTTARYSRHSLHLPAHGNIISSPASPPPSIPLPLPPKSQAKSFTSSTATSTTFLSIAPKVVDPSEMYRHDADMDTVQMHLSAIDASSDHVDLDSVLGLTADEEEAAGGGSYSHTPRSRASYLAMHDENEDGGSEGVYHPTDTFVYGYAGNVMESDRDRNGEEEEEEEEAYFRSFSASPASMRRRSATSVYATLRTRESFSARSPSSVYVGQQQQLMVASRATISVARQVVVPSRMDREREGQTETGGEVVKEGERSKRQGGEWTLGLGLEMGGAAAAATRPLVLTSSSESDLSTRESSSFSSVYSSSQAEVNIPPVVVPGPGTAAQTNSKSMKTSTTVKTPIITPDQPRAGRGTNIHLLSVPTPSSCSQFVSTSLFPSISARERTQSDPSSRTSSTMNVNEDWTLSMGVPSKERLLRATKSNLMGSNKGRKSDPTPAAASLLAAGPLVINVKDVDSGVEERLQVGLAEERESKSDMEEFHEDEVKFYVPRVVQNGRGVEDALAALTGMKRRKDVGIIRRDSGLAFLEELTVLHERQDEGDEDQQEEESDKSLDNAKANLATLDALSEDLRKFNELLKAAAGAGASAMVKPNLLSLEKSSSMQKLRTKKSTSVLQIDEPPPPNAVLRSMPSADTLFVDAVGAGVVMGVEEVEGLAGESSSAKGNLSIPLTEFTRGPPGRPRMTSRASSSALSIGSSTSGSTGNSRAPLPFAPPVSLGSTASPASISNPTLSNSNIQTEGRAPGRALSLREATALGPVSAFEHVNGPPVSLLRRAASTASTLPSTRAAAAKAQLRISIGDASQKTTSSASRSRMSTLNSQPQQTHTLTSPSSSSLDSFASCESAASGSSSTSSTPTVTPTRMAFVVSSTSLSSSDSAPTYPPVVSPVPFTSIQSNNDSSMPYPNVRTRKTALSITRASLPALPILQAPILSNANEKHFSTIQTPNPPSPVSISPTTPYTPSDTLSPLTPAASAFPLPPPLPLPLLPFQQLRASALAGAQVQLLASSEPLQHTEEDIVDDTTYDAGVNAGVVEDEEQCDESGEESMESMEYYSARSSFSL